MNYGEWYVLEYRACNKPHKIVHSLKPSDTLASDRVTGVNSADSSSSLSVLLWSKAPNQRQIEVPIQQCPSQPTRSRQTSNLVLEELGSALNSVSVSFTSTRFGEAENSIPNALANALGFFFNKEPPIGILSPRHCLIHETTKAVKKVSILNLCHLFQSTSSGGNVRIMRAHISPCLTKIGRSVQRAVQSETGRKQV
ncbi:hypothetical protein TNCV_1345851 [Trichonephila clavipes]|nr:hypothetical protein TNCV_1345851 [Trichonephila clavipes]